MDLLLYGLVNSATLTLMAMGFALVYGVSRIPNFAHGSLYVFAVCITWLLHKTVGLGYSASIGLALVLTTLMGFLIYYLVLIRVRGMPFSEIIGSLAVSMAILEGFRLAGFRGPQFALPKFVEGTVTLGGVALDIQRIIVVAVAIFLVAGLWALTHFTKVGLALRAIAQDEPASLTLGIDNDTSAAIAMGLGSALVGIAGVVIVPLGTISIEAGYEVLIFSLAVCIVGGLGSWMGAVLASVFIGFVQVATTKYFAPHWHLVVALFAIVSVLVVKPSGLLGHQKELEERV